MHPSCARARIKEPIWCLLRQDRNKNLKGKSTGKVRHYGGTSI